MDLAPLPVIAIQHRAGHGLERGRRAGRRPMSGPATRPRALSLFALPGIPMVQPGDDLAALIADGYAQAGEAAAQGDVLVVAQKIVSKSEGRYADLAAVEPGARARDLARRTGKDPRLVELILGESRRVVRHRPNVIIVEHRIGFRHGERRHRQLQRGAGGPGPAGRRAGAAAAA